jgi:hypothetical protein
MVMIGNAKDELGASTTPFDVLELARRAMGETGVAANLGTSSSPSSP